MRIRALAGLLLAIEISGAGGNAQAQSAASTPVILAALRRAMLTRPIGSIASLHTVGTVELVGLRGRAQEWMDVRDARFTVDQNAGALSGASGWDGRTAWSQDYAGLVTIDGGMAGRLQAINQAYLDSLRYLRPDAGGATIVYAGRRTDNGNPYDVLAVTPPNGTEIQLWIDPQTHLITRETTTVAAVTSATVLSNYRHVDGITYPFASSTQLSSGNSFSERVSSLEVNADVGERMRVPGQNVHDFAIAGGTSTTFPIQVVNNHVYVSNVTIEGRGPYTFVLDSGGDYIITPQVAAALSSGSSGALRLQGVGSATEGASFARVASIAVGNAVVRNQYALVLPIATGFGVAEGMRIDGMLGYQFLARFLTTIDYANSRLTLAMPSALPAAAPGAAAMQFFLDGTIPRVNVNVGDVTVSAEVDTGNRAGLELSSLFLAAHPAIAALAKTAPTVTGFGVGGPSFARLGRIPSLQIGPFQITNSVALFTAQSQGVLADPFNPANIGGALLRRFDCTFDYAHQQLLLAKNAQFDAPASYDRSGLFLIDQNGAFTVLAVLAGTPAAAAGMAKGDAIVAINGAPAGTQSLAGLRALLSSSAGTVVHLQLRNAANATRDVSLTLADYV